MHGFLPEASFGNGAKKGAKNLAEITPVCHDRLSDKIIDEAQSRDESFFPTWSSPHDQKPNPVPDFGLTNIPCDTRPLAL